jgi:hypothetical protein
MEQRVDDQINWFNTKAKWNKRWHQSLRVIEIIAAASIPVLTGYISEEASYLRTPVALLGFLIVVIAGTISLYHFQENWVQYRTSCESLTREKILFLTQAEPYDVESPFSVFVKRIESVISQDVTKWTDYTKPRDKEKDSN